MSTVLGVDADTLLYGGEALLQFGTREAPFQTRALIPFFKYVCRGTERGRPVDNGAATQGAARQDNHAQVFCSERAALQVEFWRGLGLLPGEVGFTVVAALFQDDHAFPRLSEFTSDDATSGTGANDDSICFHGGIAGNDQRSDRPGGIDRRRGWRSIVQHFPVRIDAQGVRYGEVDEAGKALHCLVALAQLCQWAICHCTQVLLTLLLGERCEGARA